MFDKQRTYSPREVCSILGIAKSTLFRWEQEGVVDKAPRDLRDRRVYHKRHLQSVATHLFREQYQAAARNENWDSLQHLHEQMALRKFFGGNQIGLRELAEFSALTPTTIRQLLRFAADELAPPDDLFADVLDLVRRHLLASQQAAHPNSGTR